MRILYSDRSNFDLVISEGCETCSSKHAFLKKIADLNNIEVQLIMGLYKMDAFYTPGIGSTISDSILDYIPEAHCYIRAFGQVIDLTSPNSFFDTIESVIMEEKVIQPNDVIEFKVSYHKSFIKQWIKEKDIKLSFEEVWAIRESCISQLSKAFKNTN